MNHCERNMEGTELNGLETELKVQKQGLDIVMAESEDSDNDIEIWLLLCFPCASMC